jgi:DNA invertase Pin-like site-specific DNA recombinase
VVGVEQWAEIRRLYFVKRLSIKEIVRRTGHGRSTIRRALRSGELVPDACTGPGADA